MVIDSGEPRNRFSAHSHGVFALDGQPGSELLATAKSQLLKYHTARFVSKKASRASKKEDFFEVETEDKERFRSRRLILATGLIDELPSIPGIRERWGKTVFHCPYCDGYEIGGGPIGVIATLPLSVHFAKLITDWGNVTLFTNGTITLDQDSRDGLTKKGVRIEERKIVGIDGPFDGLDRVSLNDGSKMSLKAIFIASLFRMAAPFADDLGCAHTQTPRGDLVQTDESKMTSVPGVYAAGDIARTTHSIPFATSDGVTAGVSAHQSLVMEEESGRMIND